MRFSRRHLLAGGGSMVAMAGLGAIPAAFGAQVRSGAGGSSPGMSGERGTGPSPGVSGSAAGPSPAMPGGGAAGPSPAVPELFPAQAPDEVREMVTVAHFDLARVRALVARRPALARAAWDWGFGDWETALGAASHMGRRDIAELLLGHGARPDLFSAAMLGQLQVVQAHVAAWPGAQGIKGPHGITLLAHARAGGEGAAPVVRYLTELGGADPALASAPLAPQDVAALAGTYRFGPGARDLLVVEPYQAGVSLRRAETMARPLSHLGARVFSPVGADAVRIRFSAEVPAAGLTIHDPDLVVAAQRLPAAAP